jgi:hypothetical protein
VKPRLKHDLGIQYKSFYNFLRNTLEMMGLSKRRTTRRKHRGK